MGLRDLHLERAYDTGSADSDVLADFYVPALGVANSYDRLAGFFSSAALAVAARGIAGLIGNGGVMRIVSCPQFPHADLELLSSLQDLGDRVALAERAAMSALSTDDLADEIARDHVRAMGWLLAEGRLEIRLAIPRDMDTAREGLFHQKVGLLSDAAGDTVSFSGSINETAAAWLENIEEFKVFKSWDASDAELVAFDRRTFDRYWGESTDRMDVVPLPAAVARQLVSYAPTDIEDLDLEQYEKARRRRRAGQSVRLRDYQTTAVDKWFAAGCRGIFEMATGTGKTKTAAECLVRLGKLEGRQLTVVTAPYQHIATQWISELAWLQPILAHGGTPWKVQVANAMADVKLGRRSEVTIVAVQDTAGSSAFSAQIERAGTVFDRLVFVGDEVHGLGAPETRKALLDAYTHRLGLSATPSRWFDDEGTGCLTDFFGDVVYTFGIKEALEWHDPDTGLSALCPYRYLPREVHLDGEELEQYMKLTEKLVYYLNKDDHESQDRLAMLLFKRAAIIKTASQKVFAVGRILDEIGDLKNGLIYCHSKDQMGDVTAMLHSRGIAYHRFTGDEGTMPLVDYGGLSERESILSGLDEGKYQALVAIKCLDEGVDVPSASLGIILASSSNPREYVQRRGRLLRRAPGKHEAVIYDVIVTPDPDQIVDPAIRKIEHDVLAKELRRIDEFGANALNALYVSTWVLQLLDRLS